MAESLEINGYSFATPAARITDLTPLFSAADKRGADLVMPGAVGARPYARIVTATQYVLPGFVFGDKNASGAPYANVRLGLTTNIDEIHDALATPPTVAGTLVATWHRADGSDWTGGVHVEGFEVSKFGPGAVKFNLALSIPAGRLVPA